MSAAQIITAALYEKLWRANALAARRFDTVFEVVRARLPQMLDAIEAPDLKVSLSELVEQQFADLLAPHFARQAAEHEAWMQAGGGTRLARHEDTLTPQQAPYLSHYRFFSDNMIWRFTTQPSDDLVYIAPGTTHQEVADVVAAHSGGADKSNPNVRTLSFGRNPGALMGVAASLGGDKKVLNIIDKAEYLYGIDIGTLARHGISAHPAGTARLISFSRASMCWWPRRVTARARSASWPLRSGRTRSRAGPRPTCSRLRKRLRCKALHRSAHAAGHARQGARSGADGVGARPSHPLVKPAAGPKDAANRLSASVPSDKELAEPQQILNSMGQYNKLLR